MITSVRILQRRHFSCMYTRRCITFRLSLSATKRISNFSSLFLLMSHAPPILFLPFLTYSPSISHRPASFSPLQLCHHNLDTSSSFPRIPPHLCYFLLFLLFLYPRLFFHLKLLLHCLSPSPSYYLPSISFLGSGPEGDDVL